MALKFDYIVVGGGVAGCVVATRLANSDPELKVLVIEAGADVSNHPLTKHGLSCFQIHQSELDWNYTTVRQTHLNDRACYNSAGKALGGGSAVNYGTWTRGHKEDYDEWARVVGDDRWSYEGMLPYFKKTEYVRHGENSDQDRLRDSAQHGYDGPIENVSVSSSSDQRLYSLREPIRQAWEAVGIKSIKDGNAGSPIGLAELKENWKSGQRQIASDAYKLSDLPNVTIWTKTIVRRVLIEETADKKANALGVELANGQRITSTKEVIVSCGAYRTPQVLLLSGIGSPADLKSHGIVSLVDLPVGKNFYDHLALCMYWRLRHPEKGLALGSALWSEPAYGLGLPADFLATSSTPAGLLKSNSEGENPQEQLGRKQEGRGEIETIIVYAPAGAQIQNTDIPFDGTHITSAIIGMLPTSRGTISLQSSDPLDPPIVDPNYYATEEDRISMRAGIRQAILLMLGTAEGQNLISDETPPAGYDRLGLQATDAEIDARIRRAGNTFFHAGGSAAMGSVVDTELKVIGVDGLRVIDASVFPVSISAHYQAPVYAVAEHGADIIIKEKTRI